VVEDGTRGEAGSLGYVTELGVRAVLEHGPLRGAHESVAPSTPGLGTTHGADSGRQLEIFEDIFKI
jgi:hypothetical protein